MGGHVTTNQTTTLDFTLDNETWIVDPGISVAVTGNAVSSNHLNSRLINKGQISASGGDNAGVLFTSNGGSIRNSGQILAADGSAIVIFTGSGQTTGVRNLKGGVIEGPSSMVALLGFDGNESIVNAGRIGSLNATFSIETSMALGSGDDSITNFLKIGHTVISGRITGTIDLGIGNDTLLGGKRPVAVHDGAGADTYRFGGGNDYYIAKAGGATDGNDIVSGGSGIDFYDVGGSVFTSCFINLDSKAHTSGATTVDANTAAGEDISGAGNKDIVTGFEHVGGSEAADLIFGNKAANQINGASGNDDLYGLGGNDLLDGSLGSDVLIGGKGADRLTGGDDSDTFRYLSLKDSTVAKNGRDVILESGFVDGQDFIGLGAIDANTKNGAATNETFAFLGVDAPFHKTPGGLRVLTTQSGWLIQGEVNGDKKPDFAIAVKDAGHVIVWSEADFLDL
jgi:Ca2+-binding RTX toxin-like protein